MSYLPPNLDDAFFPALWNLASLLRVPPEWLLIILYQESGLNPAQHTAGTRYWGLNQIDQDYLPKYGTTADDYKSWPASQQLQRVVAPFLTSAVHSYLHGVPSSPGAMYALNIVPAYVGARGSAPQTVLMSASSPDATERKYYAANKGLDFDHEGAITIRSLDRFLANKWKEPYVLKELSRLYAVAPEGTSQPSVKDIIAAPPPINNGAVKSVVAAAAGVAIGGWLLTRFHTRTR